MSSGDLTYHLVAEPYYQSQDPRQPHVPEGFAREGFIHCTDGLEELVRVGNRYYRRDPRPYLALTIDKSRVAAEIRYEDAGRRFPHIYGPLNRDAILDVTPAPRLPRGAFVMP